MKDTLDAVVQELEAKYRTGADPIATTQCERDRMESARSYCSLDAPVEPDRQNGVENRLVIRRRPDGKWNLTFNR